MKINMGVVDQVIRVLIALLISILYFTNVISGVFGIVLLLLAVILLATSIFRFCPIYLPFGISTCKSK
jgi:hypothetical protein